MSKYSYDHNSPIEIYLTNPDTYTEREPHGEWLALPTTPVNLQKTLQEIDVKTSQDRFSISDCDLYVDGLESRIFGDFEDLDELNYLASLIEELDEVDYQLFCAALEYESPLNVKDLINLIDSLDSYLLLPEVDNDYELGYYYVEEVEIYDLSELWNLRNYIDYESFGRDIRLDEGGIYTKYGYLYEIDSRIITNYSGVDDIPEEYRLRAVSFVECLKQ